MAQRPKNAAPKEPATTGRKQTKKQLKKNVATSGKESKKNLAAKSAQKKPVATTPKRKHCYKPGSRLSQLLITVRV
jgi:hypothetical protein